MKDHKDCIRGFYVLSQAWYSKIQGAYPFDDKVVFGWYHPEGGTTGEMDMCWHDLGTYTTPRLEAFNDSWHALHTFSDVIEKLAELDEKRITRKQFCELLLSLGFTDLTEYERKGVSNE